MVFIVQQQRNTLLSHYEYGLWGPTAECSRAWPCRPQIYSLRH